MDKCRLNAIKRNAQDILEAIVRAMMSILSESAATSSLSFFDSSETSLRSIIISSSIPIKASLCKSADCCNFKLASLCISACISTVCANFEIASSIFVSLVDLVVGLDLGWLPGGALDVVFSVLALDEVFSVSELEDVVCSFF
ncbi:uncharacterized protein LOC131632348 [Vicia villosa]|uniref:uncharacterized protein LOC131632348 n=1 Tax=Vicia villosa TaxID=3911 RepID=UPI00273C32C8|nr:uncharacterized protein LOC131632348 [Vicia villosa]